MNGKPFGSDPDLIRIAASHFGEGKKRQKLFDIADKLADLEKFKENHKDGWAYARKMDKLRQEAEKKVKTQEELMELVNKVAEAYNKEQEENLSGCCASCERPFTDISDPAVGHLVCTDCVAGKAELRYPYSKWS